MQKLQFESAWEKTIAPDDRQTIEDIFNKEVTSLTSGVHFSFLWQAINHKGDRLVTVLIHNCEKTNLHIENTVVTYHQQEQVIATGTFTLPCNVDSYTTMPWTFIFKENNHVDGQAKYFIKQYDKH